MSSDTDTLSARASVLVSVGCGSQVGVIPLHRGHHAVWADKNYQADICNQVDDVVVRDLTTGLLYRFPIDADLLPWVSALTEAMNDYDQQSGSPWCVHNETVRGLLVDAAACRIDGCPPQRNVFEPGMVGPAVTYNDGPVAVDEMFATIIAQRPDSVVPE